MDARIRYTKKAIRDAFLKLLKKQPLSKITVKGICDVAEINRATFYKYYDNAYDLLDKMELELLDNLQNQITAAASKDPMVTFRIIMEDVSTNKDMYLVLFSENGDMLFREKLFKGCYDTFINNIKSTLPNMDAREQDWLYYYVAEGANGVLKQWIKNDMKDSVSDVIDFLGKVINYTNKAFETAL